MLIRETFPNSMELGMINEYDKATVMQVSTVLVDVYHVPCRTVV